MPRARGRLTKIVLIAVAVLCSSYWVADNHLVIGPTINVRNETAFTAFVDLVGYDDDGDDKVSVPPWKPGMCETATWAWHHHGDPAAAGNGTAVMSAEPGSTTEVRLTQFADGQPLYVRIDATGTVHAGESVPVDPVGCAQYSVRSGWSWVMGQ
jgi:hypothetical protein